MNFKAHITSHTSLHYSSCQPKLQNCNDAERTKTCHSAPSSESAYKQFHSTETTLIKVKNDLLLAMDRSEVSILILLDLSVAFDTINHKILLDDLSTRFGVKDKTIDWIKSYLSGRTQAVKIGEECSKKCSTNLWYPTRICRGSSLVHKLFCTVR